MPLKKCIVLSVVAFFSCLLPFRMESSSGVRRSSSLHLVQALAVSHRVTQAFGEAYTLARGMQRLCFHVEVLAVDC